MSPFRLFPIDTTPISEVIVYVYEMAGQGTHDIQVTPFFPMDIGEV